MERSRVNWHMALVIGAIAIVTSLALLFVVPTTADDLDVTAAGIVSKVEKDTTERRGRTSTTYRTQVTFEVDGQGDVTAWQIVSGGSRRHHEGESVTVRYNPTNPEAGCLIVGDEYLIERNNVITVVLMASGGIVCLVAGSQIMRQRRVRATTDGEDPEGLAARDVVALVAGGLAIVASVVMITSSMATTPTATVDDEAPDEDAQVQAEVQVETPSAVPHAELKATKLGQELSGEFEDLGSEDVKGYLAIRNASKEAMTLNTTFTYWSEQGARLFDYADDAPAVSPGKTVVLRAKLNMENATRITYRVTCDAPQSWMRPLGKDVVVKEVSHTADTVRVKVTNKGESPVEIRRISCKATDAEGNVSMAEQSCGAIEPGESREKNFYSFTMYDRPSFVSWDDFEREYYVSGYAK